MQLRPRRSRVAQLRRSDGTERVSSNVAGVNQAAAETSAAALRVRAVSEQLTQETFAAAQYR